MREPLVRVRTALVFKVVVVVAFGLMPSLSPRAFHPSLVLFV